VQNAEQQNTTLWNRIKRHDIFLARDRITRELSVLKSEPDAEGKKAIISKKDMKKDLSDLKKLVVELLSQSGNIQLSADQHAVMDKLYQDYGNAVSPTKGLLAPGIESLENEFIENEDSFVLHEEFEESLSLEEREKELILKALEKHRGKRKYAALELGISERTLYRKIKEYNLAE
jgi:transcriptional regulator of acetoin/glycerol metabolism